ncbi:MAG: PAS domain-containing protein [bacterium]
MAEDFQANAWFEEHRNVLFIHDIIKEIVAGTINEQNFYTRLLESLSRIIPCELAFILQKDKKSGALELGSIYFGNKIRCTKDASILKIEKNLAQWAYQIRETIILNDKILDISIEDTYSPNLAPKSNSYLFAPQIYHGVVLGVIGMINKSIGNFTQIDKYVIEAAGNLAILYRQLSENKADIHEPGIQEMDILQNMTSGFIGLDDEGKIFAVNPKACDILELSENIKGKYYFEVLPLKQSLFQKISEGLKNQTTEARSFSTINLESERKIGYSTFIITASNKQPKGLGLLFQDITNI